MFRRSKVSCSDFTTSLISLINVDNMLMHVSDANLFKEASGSTLADPKYQITFPDLIRSLTKGLKVVCKVTYPPESGLSPLYISSGTLPKIKMYEAMQNGKHVVSQHTH